MYLKLYYLWYYSIIWNFLKVEKNCKTKFFPIFPFFFLIYQFLLQNFGLPLVGDLGGGLSGLGLGPAQVIHWFEHSNKVH